MRSLARTHFLIVAISGFGMSALCAFAAGSDPKPDEIKRKIKQCFDAEIAKFMPVRQFTGPTQHADCRPASLPLCDRNNDIKDLSYTTDPQWRIVGQPTLKNNSLNGGYFGGPTVDVGRRTVNAFAACNGSGCGGPGRWAEGYVVGSEQRVPTEDENKQVVGTCFNRIFRE